MEEYDKKYLEKIKLKTELQRTALDLDNGSQNVFISDKKKYSILLLLSTLMVFLLLILLLFFSFCY